jgi:transposase-like protein
VGRVRQPQPPPLPADATPIAPAAGLVDGADGGAVFVFGQATSAFATEDEVGRRLAAVQLVATGIASSAAVAAGFGIGLTTLWRWKAAHDARSARTPGCWTRNASCSPTPSRWPPITPSPPSPGCCARPTPRADDEARALLREAFTLSGDLHITGDTLHVRLDPATAPRRSRALHALCQQLTETGTRYPDTNLTISYSVKGQPDTS